MESDSGHDQSDPNNNNNDPDRKTKRAPGSTTSLGKRRSLRHKRNKSKGRAAAKSNQAASTPPATASPANKHHHQSPVGPTPPGSTMSNPHGPDYGSQASPLRVPTNPSEITKVAILGAAGGIGQPLALLLMLHSEYIQHLALYDLVHVRGVGADLSHIDRQCKVTTHLGPDELAECVRNCKVVIIPAGLAQKPGMSRDDLFGSNAKIVYNLARVCAQVAPQAQIALISNPVNSLVPLFCEVYSHLLCGKQHQQQHQAPAQNDSQQPVQQQQQAHKSEGRHCAFNDCFRRIYGLTTLDVVRASTLTARSAMFKSEPNGLFKDPAKVQVPVVGGHAGKTIIPLLSQATPKLDRKRLAEDKATTSTLIESIQEAGIEVLNAKKGAGSATLSMAYAACRFTISLLRAQQGEQNIVECAYVRHQQPIVQDLEYFSTPLVLGKDGYAKSLGLGKVMPFEQQMIDDGARELRSSVAKGEDFAREQLSSSS